MNKKKPTCIQWNPKGDLLCTNNQGGNMQVWDMRAQQEAMHTTQSHLGGKSQKSIFVRDDIIISTGFDKTPSSEYAVWDLRNMAEAVFRGKLSKGQSVVNLLMNRQHDIIYSFGKG